MMRLTFSVATGTADGHNTVFELPRPYVPKSLVVYLNGRASVATFDDGWVELGGRKLQMKVPPRPGDTIMAFFMAY
jgi:hypothetical protein